MKNMIKSVIRLLRPKQWIKNLVMFAAIIFAVKLTSLDLLVKVIAGFVIFSAISSSVYIFNDIKDIEGDRAHHRKKFRPIASGAISIQFAVFLFIVLFLFSIFFSYQLNFNFFIIILLYFIINVFYTLYLKEIIIIDIMVIASGFILRAIAGAFIIDTMLSSWLILCTLLLSLFLAINKRRSEKITMIANTRIILESTPPPPQILLKNIPTTQHVTETRKILSDYSLPFIDKMLSIVTPSILIAYILFTMSENHSQIFMTTTFFIIYGLFRYEYIADKTDLAESPELALLNDKPLLINVILWIMCSIGMLYF